MKNYLLAILTFSVMNQTMGQELSGRVVDATTNEGIPSVSIIVKSIGVGTFSDIDGYFNLSNSLPSEFDVEVSLATFETQRIKVKRGDTLLIKLKEVDPYAFEKIILILLNKMGYGDFIETAKSGDGGIDGIINEDQLGLEKIYIQAKRYNTNKVRETDIRNFIGAMSGDTRKGIFVTTSSFDEKAKVKARDAHHTIILVDGSKLVDLMHKFNVGVQIKNVYEIKILDNDFFDAEEL